MERFLMRTDAVKMMRRAFGLLPIVLAAALVFFPAGKAWPMAQLTLQNGTDFLCPGCGISPNIALENILQLKKARDDYFCLDKSRFEVDGA